MAMIERIELSPAFPDSTHSSESMPGLRISKFGSGPKHPGAVSARCTTASFSDYAEWDPVEHEIYRRGLITDGACS
jgi:hypothetical protein